MLTKWIFVGDDAPAYGETVFVHSGKKDDRRYPVAACWNAREFFGVSKHDFGKVYDDVQFWFPRDGLPDVPILPGCYSLDSLAETRNFLLSLSNSTLGLSEAWVFYRHSKAKAFFSWVPGETRLEVDPVSLVAEINVWEEPLENLKPVTLDFYVQAKEHYSGDLVLISQNEWNASDIPTRSEIERRKFELATSV